MRLSLSCPNELSDDQWVYCIVWTWNLHSNYGLLPGYIPTSDLQRIVEEFESKINAGPNLTTIDWFWDEYFLAAPLAHNYEHWRPTSPANKTQFQTGAHGGNPLLDWRAQYEQRVKADSS